MPGRQEENIENEASLKGNEETAVIHWHQWWGLVPESLPWIPKSKGAQVPYVK